MPRAWDFRSNFSAQTTYNLGFRENAVSLMWASMTNDKKVLTDERIDCALRQIHKQYEQYVAVHNPSIPLPLAALCL
jgi:hypothetical protein